MGDTLTQKKEQAKVTVADIQRHGEKIIIPQTMMIKDAITVLQRALEQDEMVVNLMDEFDCFVLDGAWALKKAMEEKYGFMDLQSSFWNPPALINVVIDEDKNTVAIPWGQMGLPCIPKGDGHLVADVAKNSQGRLIFRLTGNLKQKWSFEFKALCSLVRKHLQDSSLYKGKAVSIRFKDDAGRPIPLPQPTFIRLNDISENSLIFSRQVDAAIKTNLFTPIQNTRLCREQKIPLKRGVLLAGDYGVGKTLVAYATAKIAAQNGWTFIYCQNIGEFSEVMRFAQMYEPVVVFCEDIDKVLEGQRDVSMDQVLNVMDGVDSKKSEVLVILTTNNVEKIHQAALRPGRLDAVIHVERPDAEAAERLIRLYANGLLSDTTDLTAAAHILAGKIPAVIREAVERSKLSAIRLAKGGEFNLTGEAVLEAAESMQMQLRLLEQEQKIAPTEMERFGHTLGAYIVDAVENIFTESPTVGNAITQGIQDASKTAISNGGPATATKQLKSKGVVATDTKKEVASSRR